MDDPERQRGILGEQLQRGELEGRHAGDREVPSIPGPAHERPHDEPDGEEKADGIAGAA
jgi:hypothetical protein